MGDRQVSSFYDRKQLDELGRGVRAETRRATLEEVLVWVREEEACCGECPSTRRLQERIEGERDKAAGGGEG